MNWENLFRDITTAFDAPTRQQACGLAHDLSTLWYIVNLHFALDILNNLNSTGEIDAIETSIDGSLILLSEINICKLYSLDFLNACLSPYGP